MRQLLRRDKGNALIMGALSFAVLTAFGVLTIDIGRILLTKNQLQNGADAAALAGASVYCDGTPAPTEAEAIGRAQLVGQSNSALGLKGDQKLVIPSGDVLVTDDPATSSHRVDVTTRSTTGQYFLRLLDFKGWFKDAGVSTPGNLNSDDVTAVAAAQCGATCGVKCIKPWSPPDRWDDVTPITGYDGTVKGLPNWRNNGKYDEETFTDTNGNFMYDPGEPYKDDNNNGKFDQEFYSPTLTGYVPDPIPGNPFAPTGDLGLQLTLFYDNGNSTPVPGNYQAIDLPPINRGNPISGADQYRENIASCNQSGVWPGDWLATEPGGMVGPTNQGMRDLIAQDPDAYWDPITQSVQNSAFSISPRIVLIPMYDPRIYPTPGKGAVQVTKVAAFFMERVTGNSQVQGRFLKVRAPGEPCVAGNGAGGSGISFTYSLSLIK